MGYYVDLRDFEFFVPEENFPAVIQRWREFEQTEAFTTHHYSGIFEDDTDQLDVEPDIQLLFEAIGFDVRVDAGGGLTVEGWGSDGAGKSWMEGEYIHAIRDLADEGWYLDWHGEDDEHWRQTAAGSIGGEMVYIEPSLYALLTEAEKVLSTYDDTLISINGVVPIGALTEMQAAGPVADMLRTLIDHLRGTTS